MDQSLLGTQLGVSAMIVAFMEWLKSTKLFPYVTHETAILNRVLAVVLSGLGTLGIHFAWTHGNTSGVYIVTITGATVSGITAGAWLWFKQFWIQQFVYWARKPATPAAASATTKPQP